jgi:hypothetical protein
VSHLTAEAAGALLWKSDDLDVHDTVLAMSLVRASWWQVTAAGRMVYDGPSFTDAVHAVQDHDETAVFYLHDTLHEITRLGGGGRG